MKAFYDPRQAKHDPQYFISNGVQKPSPEQPERIVRLQQGAKAAGCEFEPTEDFGIAPIAAVHSSEYLVFLQNIYQRWSRIEGAALEVIPNVHPISRSDNYPKSAIGQAGYHQADTACPIGEHTWLAAYWSAQTALSAAHALLNGVSASYVLSRPPGHHAYADMAGGFCFLNNAAIAAQFLLANGCRPAVLDVDVHHGNGTQGIFYHRQDVLTVSLHADPQRFYPFFWGAAHERGAGDGLGSNLNIPLVRGTGDDDYLAALKPALARIKSYGCDALVVALGLDAFIDDPFKGLAITTPGFARIAAAIAEANIKTIFVQEGGYLCPQLGDNLEAFLTGYQEAAKI